jgi:hypothetical protein
MFSAGTRKEKELSADSPPDVTLNVPRRISPVSKSSSPDVIRTLNRTNPLLEAVPTAEKFPTAD